MQKLAFSRWIYFTYVQNYFSGPMAIAPMGLPLGRTVPNERNCNVKPRLSAMVIHRGGGYMPTGVHSWGSKRGRSRLFLCVCQSLGDCVTPRRRSRCRRCVVGRESTTAQRGIGTFRIPPLSSGVWTETICIPRAQRCWAPGGATACNHGYRFNHSCKDVGEKK